MIMRLKSLFELIKRMNMDGIIITSYPNVFYFSKFTSEDCILFINKEKAYLITDSRYTLQAKKQAKGFDVIIRKSTYLEELKKLVNGGKILFEESISYATYSSFNKGLDAILVSTNIDEMRNIKENEEILQIKKACKIADNCYTHILKFVKSGMREIEIANEMNRYMKEIGASKESFEMIVASGKRGALPHGVASNKRIRDGEFVTIDYGCVYKGYCSDITRSFCLGKPNYEMKKIYNIVKKAQLLAIKSIKAGIRAYEVDKVARDYIESRGYGKYFVHSTGHGLGIEVHDPISVNRNSNTVLEENMVITVEPGIYIPGKGGIRIEDDVLVTKDGYKVLTKATKKLVSIE